MWGSGDRAAAGTGLGQRSLNVSLRLVRAAAQTLLVSLISSSELAANTGAAKVFLTKQMSEASQLLC